MKLQKTILARCTCSAQIMAHNPDLSHFLCIIMKCSTMLEIDLQRNVWSTIIGKYILQSYVHCTTRNVFCLQHYAKQNHICSMIICSTNVLSILTVKCVEKWCVAKLCAAAAEMCTAQLRGRNVQNNSAAEMCTAQLRGAPELQYTMCAMCSAQSRGSPELLLFVRGWPPLWSHCRISRGHPPTSSTLL